MYDRVLNLLKEIVKNNNVLDRDLFVSIKEGNKYSEQVVIKNGGKLCFSGEIPIDVPIYFIML